VVSLSHLDTKEPHLQTADIVILGAGVPALVSPSMIKNGVVIFDAGTSEEEGKLAGDADPSCVSVASLITPVPGGIGPIAVALLFSNLYTLGARKDALSMD
jgi:methylenetetrahydrofolate dehydrogenase (NADP+)/methenyltetrahydrofolate cyclohydrolase